MLKSILPSTAFYGNLEAGPKVFMSDNNSEIRDALQTVWSKATLLLCIFHLLQQVWRGFLREHMAYHWVIVPVNIILYTIF